MILVVTIQLAVVIILVGITAAKGLERALPFFVFVVTIVPGACGIPIPGLFVLTTQRTALLTLLTLFIVVGKRNGKSPPLPLKWIIIAQVAWCVVSTAHSVVFVDSIKKMIGEVAEYYFLYYVLSRTISDVRTVRKIVSALVVAVAIACMFGAFEAYSTWRVLNWLPAADARLAYITGDDGRGDRITSTFGHPILFGAAIALALPLSMYLISNARSRIQKALLWGSVLLMFLSLYKTSSRGPWLASIGSFVLLLPICGNKIRRYVLGICILCLAVLIIRPGVWDTVRDMYQETQDSEAPLGKSYEYRYALWNVVKTALDKNESIAAWGYGMESFYFLNLKGQFLDKPDHEFLSCDSAWMEFAIETGYIGLCLIVMLLLGAAYKTAQIAFRLGSPANNLSWIFLVNLSAYYFMMLSVAMYAWGQTGDMLWILIASSLAYGRVAAKPAARKVSLVPHNSAVTPSNSSLESVPASHSI